MTASISAASCSPQQAQALFGARDDAQWIDVREFPEYAGGHVARARLLPVGQVEARISELDLGRPIVVICKSGKRAAKAAEILVKAGGEQVTVVEGGTDAWVAAGLGVEKLKGAPWALERQVRLIAGVLVLVGCFIPGWPWLAAFVGAGLTFAGLTNWCGMAMLLAKMPWNRAGASCGAGR